MKLIKISTIAFAALLSLSAPIPSFAQGEDKKDEQKKEEPKKDPKTEEYEKAVKDLKRFEGNFTLYQRKKEILLELPESKLGKLFLIQAACNTGFMGDGLQAGFPVGGNTIDVFRFEKNEDSVWLFKPNTNFRWESGDPLAVASARSFPEAILGSFRIEATNVEKKLLLVNITNLFYGDFLLLSDMIQMMVGPYGLDREKSGPESIKVFPENDVVRMKLHYFNPRPQGPNPLMAAMGLGAGTQLEDERSIPFKVTYNFWWREDTGYMPRQADPRVGYFTQDFYNVARFSQDDRTERFVLRWNLKKKDPKAAISEPVKPIVWFIDNSVPEIYREACKEGILYWNRAFEALGYKNAVVVKDAPKDDPEWDHADGRHNVLRWAMSPDASYAIALFRNDPFTGQILSASVNFDAGMPQFGFWEHEKVVVPATSHITDRAIDILTRAHEAKLPSACKPEDYLWDGERAVAQAEIASKMARFGWRSNYCNYAREKLESAATGWAALTAGGKLAISSTRYAQDFVRDVVSHEIGHCFGLRHNFIASMRNTTAELADDTLLKNRSVTSSVMDYTPVNVQAILKGNGVFFAPRIGEYDMWAIKYGYMDVPGAATPAGERFALAKVAALSGLPENRYMSDENADGWDPAVVRFDLAKDPLNYSQRMLDAVSNIEHYAINELPKAGQSYSKRTTLLKLVLQRTFREGRSMARFVGGINASKSYAGDSGASSTLRPVSAADQRRALQIIANRCFSYNAFNWPESVMMNLAEDPNSDLFSSWNAPIRQIVSQSQIALYATLMSDATLRRIVENQYKWKSNPSAYRLDEHFSTLLGAAFSEVGTGKPSSANRRDLQRFAVQALIVQAGAPSNAVHEDVRMLANDSLRRLQARFASAAKKGGVDGMTAVFYRDTAANIGRFLNRTATGL